MARAPQEPGASVAVATTSTSVVATNGRRGELDITNDSDTVIYLRLDSSGAQVNKGIRLNPNGGSYHTELYRGSISAIHANKDATGGTTTGATKTLCVAEY